MIRVLAFNIVLLAVAAYAWRRGGGPERWTAAMFVIAGALTYLAPVIPGLTFVRLQWERVAVDMLLLCGLLAIVAVADRFWPMWCTAVHLLTVATHGVRAYDPAVLPIVYTRVSAWLAYPMLAILVAGTWRHARRARGGPDVDWTFQRRVSADDAGAG